MDTRLIIGALLCSPNTEQELIASILSRLPGKVRELLALGPIGDDEGDRGCRLCDTMAECIDTNDERQVMLANVLLDFHAVDNSQGPECFRRCCQIYKAAGWKGVPNG